MENSIRRRIPAQSGAPDRMARSRSRKAEQWRELALGYFFLAPSLLLFAVFLFYPLVKSVYLSLQLTDPRGRVAAFAGFDNYRELLTSAEFYHSLGVTALFTVYTVPVGVIVALVLAAMTHRPLRGMKALQWIFSMPVAISAGTGSVIWQMLYHPTTGTLNYFLKLAGLPTINWLTDPSWALLSISLMTVWMHSGFLYIVLLGALKGIPADLFESAQLDGAGAFRTFRSITLPLLSPTLFFATVVSVINSFQSFGQIRILTEGGPVHSTDVMVYKIYRDAFVNFQFGTGSAQALVLFVLILILTVVQFGVLERKVHYQ